MALAGARNLTLMNMVIRICKNVSHVSEGKINTILHIKICIASSSGKSLKKMWSDGKIECVLR